MLFQDSDGDKETEKTNKALEALAYAEHAVKPWDEFMTSKKDETGNMII